MTGVMTRQLELGGCYFQSPAAGSFAKARSQKIPRLLDVKKRVPRKRGSLSCQGAVCSEGTGRETDSQQGREEAEPASILEKGQRTC